MDRQSMASRALFILELLSDHYGGEGWDKPGLVDVVENDVDSFGGWRHFDYHGEEHGIAAQLISRGFDPREAL